MHATVSEVFGVPSLTENKIMDLRSYIYNYNILEKKYANHRIAGDMKGKPIRNLVRKKTGKMKIVRKDFKNLDFT